MSLTAIQKKFLKERHLLKSFQKFKQLKNLKQRRATITYQGNKRNVLAYRKNNKTFIADAYTLRTLTYTKKYSLNNFQKGFIENVSGRGSKKQKKTKLNISTLKQEYFKYSVIETRSKPLRSKVGKLFLSITWHKGKEKITTEGGSRRLKDLSSQFGKSEAYDEAFKGALSQVPFSYDYFVINWTRFRYGRPRRRGE